MNISGAKLEEHCFNISRDTVFFIQYFTILVANLMMSSLPILNVHNTKMSVSLEQKKISKKENAILYFEKSLSNKQQLFFMS